MSLRSCFGDVRRFFGPLFIDPLSLKELSGIARRWQTYVGRGLHIALIGAILWMFWTSLTRGQAWMSPSAYAELGRSLFHAFFILQLVVVTFGGMSSASDMINRELRGGTLGLLALTPLTPWRIVAGKWKAALIQTSTALLCGVPAFAVCAYLGGVGTWEIIYTIALSLGATSLAAAVALLCSTYFRAGYVVTIVSFVSLLIYCIVPIVIGGVMEPGEWYMTFLCYSHLLFASFGAAVGRGFGFRMAWQYGWISASLLSSVLVYALLRQTAARVRVLIRRPGGRAPERPSLEDLSRASRAQEPEISTAARLLRGTGGVWESWAILWKELSTRRHGTGVAARAGIMIFAFLLLTTLPSGGEWRVLMLWFSVLILLLVALANGVSLFVTEREERKWEILLTTPLKAVEIVLAKLAAGLAGLVPISLLLAVFWSLVALAWNLGVRGTLMAGTAIALATLFTYVLAAFTSLNARTQRGAFAAAFGILIGLLCVAPILLFMMQSFRILPSDPDVAGFIVASSNPGTYLAHVSGAVGRPIARIRWDDAGWEDEHLSAFRVYGAGYSAVIVGLVFWMVHRFDRAAGRC